MLVWFYLLAQGYLAMQMHIASSIHRKNGAYMLKSAQMINYLTFTNNFKSHIYCWLSYTCMSGYCTCLYQQRGHSRFDLILNLSRCQFYIHIIIININMFCYICRFSKTAKIDLFSRGQPTNNPTESCLQECQFAPSLFLLTKTIRDFFESTLNWNGCKKKKNPAVEEWDFR